MTVNDVHWFCLFHIPHDTLWTCKRNVTSDVVVTVTFHWFCLFHTIHCEHANMECYIRCHCDSQCSLGLPVPHNTLWTYKHGMLHQMSLWQLMMFTGSACSVFHTIHCKHTNMLQQVSPRQDKKRRKKAKTDWIHSDWQNNGQTVWLICFSQVTGRHPFTL